MANLTKDELNLIHEIKKDFITKKLALGDLELHKVKILKEVEAIEKVLEVILKRIYFLLNLTNSICFITEKNGTHTGDIVLLNLFP